MASTEAKSAASHHEHSERSDFAVRVQYRNDLPELNYDAKSIPYSFDLSKFTAYQTTTLEKNHSFDLQFEENTGVDVNLVDLEYYKKVNTPITNAVDRSLLVDESRALEKPQMKPKNTSHVSWLRRPNMINVDYCQSTKPSTVMERTIHADSSYSTSKAEYQTREAQIASIERTFEEAAKPITEHHTNKSLKPVAVHQVLPDGILWKHAFSLINFDSKPTVQGAGAYIKKEQFKDSLLRGMTDSCGDYVGFFVKNDNLNYGCDSDCFTYEMIREYSWMIQNISLGGTEDLYVWKIDPQRGVLYNEISAKVRLNKRRVQGGQLKNNSCDTLLTVKHRQPKPDEVAEQKNKVLQLTRKNVEPPLEGLKNDSPSAEDSGTNGENEYDFLSSDEEQVHQ